MPLNEKSAFLWDPFVNPKADTLSYFLNAPSSGLAPVYFLRWAWRAYLQLDESHQPKSNDPLGKGSNRELVLKSPIFQNKALWRLCDPSSDIPSGLNSKSATKFLITSATGDPLFDEGKDFAIKLKENGAFVSYTSCKGSHILAYAMDVSKQKKLMAELRKFVFDEDVQDFFFDT